MIWDEDRALNDGVGGKSGVVDSVVEACAVVDAMMPVRDVLVACRRFVVKLGFVAVAGLIDEEDAAVPLSSREYVNIGPLYPVPLAVVLVPCFSFLLNDVPEGSSD